jgi:predicted secreted hydrolase
LGLLWLAVGSASWAADYAVVEKHHVLQFPRDHGAHPRFRTEWWYVTGWALDASGQPFGFQITFFRSRTGLQEDNPSSLAPRQLMFAHVALANARLGKLLHEQRSARLLPGVVEAGEQNLQVRLQGWQLVREGARIRSSVAARDFAWNLHFTPTQSVMPQGEGGFSRKGPGEHQASHYYSEPQLKVSGEFTVRGEKRTVTGTAWLDHEWFSEMLPVEAVGWDWTGINFDDGRALMAFRIRSADGRTVWSGGQWRYADGRVLPLARADSLFVAGRRWRSPRSGAEYPVEWRLALPGTDLSLVPLMEDQELDGRFSNGALYWEGAVTAHEGGRITGRGYLEMTGYASPIRF